MRVIGTAGHVDHGKSTLVSALTGIHPDRLKEEQDREMTIDLGFAWFTLPNGEEVGIVDVPGHRDFIENMLAGIGGIDAVLFIIAADEGVMPQTREHLSIVDLLQTQGGVVALTKIDLVDEPEWIDLVKTDINKVLNGTVLQNAPIIPVSARTGIGLTELTSALEECLVGRPFRPDLGRPRLPVDRVFTLSGFGTVVTGTLIDGHFEIGEEVEILPERTKGRIRGLQSHKTKTKIAVPGSRSALNISGVNVDQVKRGDVISLPGVYQPTQLIDVHFRLLPDARLHLCHNSEMKLYIGSTEVAARVRLLGIEELVPGNVGWLQLELAAPITTVRGDHYILRRPSPGETLGGGVVVDPLPGKRHKRFSRDIIDQLELLKQGSPAEVLLQASLAMGPVELREVISRSRLSKDQAIAAYLELLDQEELIQLQKGVISEQTDIIIIAKPQWTLITLQVLSEIKQYHRLYPFRKGIPREELKSRLKLPGRVFNAIVMEWVGRNVIAEKGNTISLPGFSVQFPAQQQNKVDGLLRQFSLNPFGPPCIKDCIAAVGEEVYNALVDNERFVEVSDEVVYRKEDYQEQLDILRLHFEKEANLTVAQFRDLVKTSRRYALAILEHLDIKGVTVREGDSRRLKTSR